MANSTGAKSSGPQAARAESPLRSIVLMSVAVVAIGVASWFIYQQMFPKPKWNWEISNTPRETNLDTVTADQLLDLPLTDDQGKPVVLRERVGKKHLVIVVTRGSLASVAAADKGKQSPKWPNVCPYCSSQISGIASQASSFDAQGAEIVVIFPVSKSAEAADLATLKKATGGPDKPAPFPILLDVDLQAVKKLNLEAHLARPSSFIVDQAGNLRFAYVAKDGTADRPSGGELLRHVTKVNAEFAAKPAASPETTEPDKTP